MGVAFYPSPVRHISGQTSHRIDNGGEGGGGGAKKPKTLPLHVCSQIMAFVKTGPTMQSVAGGERGSNLSVHRVAGS